VAAKTTSCLREPVFKFLSIRLSTYMLRQRGFFLGSPAFRRSDSKIQDRMADAAPALSQRGRTPKAR